MVSAYLITSTVTTPIYGRLSDLYGRRPVLLVWVSIFVAGAVLAALAPTMLALIAARVVQGLGGGGLRAISLAVVGDILPPRERGRVQGYLSATFATADLVGELLGGLFVEYLSWHWIFWINLPLGAAAFATTFFQLRRLPLPGRRPKIDWLGALLILLSCTPLLLGITFVQRAASWTAPEALGYFALGLAFLVALIAQERLASQPMLPLQLFRSPVFSVGILVTSLSSMVMMALVILVPLDYQLVAGLSPKDSGLRIIAMTLGSVTGSFLAGQAVSATGRYRPFAVLGAAVAACDVPGDRLRRAWPFAAAGYRRDPAAGPVLRLPVLADDGHHPECGGPAGWRHRGVLHDVLPADGRRLRGGAAVPRCCSAGCRVARQGREYRPGQRPRWWRRHSPPCSSPLPASPGCAWRRRCA